MTVLRSQLAVFCLRVYVAINLVISTLYSPLVLSIVPVTLLLAYLYLWRRPVSAVVSLLADYFAFFAVAVLLAPVVGDIFSVLISLPVLLLVHHGLERSAEFQPYADVKRQRSPTNIFLFFLMTAIITLSVSLLLGSLSLLLACAATIIYFGVLGVVVLRGLPSKPVEETQIERRMLAGSADHIQVKLAAATKIGGRLFVESPYEWVKADPGVLSLKQNRLEMKLSLSPTLSGPSAVKLKAHAVDKWGLIQTSFELEPVRLYVIPRARYAEWLARRYLAETKPGVLPLMSDMAAINPVYGLRSGLEYYGSRLYQPGDSLKDIDWKHSYKYNEMITKEFAEFRGQPGIVLVNLAVRDAEEADKLAYVIIVTAMSLVEKDIPVVLAAYSDEKVEVTTSLLQPRQLLVESLRIAREMVTYVNPVKYLSPPDIARLKDDIRRVQSVGSEASEALVRLLRLEYKNFETNARLNPATEALSRAFAKVDRQCNVLVISHHNHDAEALAINTFRLARSGNAVLSLNPGELKPAH